MGERIRVLYVDADPERISVVPSALERHDERVSVTTARTVEAALDELDGVDCVVSELALPDRDGLAFLDTVRADTPELPFLVFTDEGSERAAGEAVARDATDYLRKGDSPDQYARLGRRVVQSVERRRTERELERTTRLFQLTQAIADVGAWEYDPAGGTLRWSDGMYRLYGLPETVEPGLDLAFEQYHPDDRDRVRAAFERAVDEGEGYDVEARLDTAEVTWVQTRANPTTSDGPAALHGTVQDITARKRRERELDRSQQRYRALFEKNPLTLWEEDFTEAKRYLDRLAAETDDLRAYLRANPEAVHAVLDRIEVVGVNQRAVDYYGASSKAALLDSFDELFTETAFEQFIEVCTRLVEGADEYRGETVVETLDGERRHELMKVYVPDTPGDEFRTYVAGVDITERKHREESIEALHGGTRDLMEATTHREIATTAASITTDILDLPMTGVWLASEDGSALEPVAMSERGTDCFDKQPRFEAGESLAWQAFRRGETLVYDDVTTEPGCYNPDTPVRSEIIVPLGDHGVLAVGSPDSGVFGPTEQSLAEVLAANTAAALDRADRQRELAAKNERLDEFASIVSHDLRNPLNVANGHLELARQECDTDHHDEIQRAHDRMSALIDDLLSLARQGEDVDAVEPVELAEIARRCWSTIDTERASLTVETDREVQADPGRLRQLLANLLRNAVEHGGEAVTVRIEALPAGDGFAVADDGLGIPAEERDQVFEPGFTTNTDGTGFGLAIVDRIAEAHGWRVELRASDTGGAKFCFRTE